MSGSRGIGGKGRWLYSVLPATIAIENIENHSETLGIKKRVFRALDKSFKGVLTHFCPIVYQISNRILNISCFFLNRNIRWYQIHIVILIQIYSAFDDDDQEA